jgi:Amt family ammonium transporter
MLDGGNTAWILTSTALVLFMTIPGLSLFYAGLVRGKNVLSVLMQCFTITCLMSILWMVLGYSLAFDDQGYGFIGGLGKAFMNGVTEDSLTGDIPESAFALFQMTFAIITPALIVGGFAERMRFSAVLIFSALWLLLVYAPICHWVWGGGWLGQMGLMDFAGGTVVHITAGTAAIVAARVLGNRRGFPDQAMMPHNMLQPVRSPGCCANGSASRSPVLSARLPAWWRDSGRSRPRRALSVRVARSSSASARASSASSRRII